MGGISHKMCVNALQLACNQLLLLVFGGLAIFRSMSFIQENWEALPLAYTLPKQKYKSFQCQIIAMFQKNILAVCSLMSIF